MHQIVAPHAYGKNGIPTHFEILNVSFDACYLPRDKRMLDFVLMKCVSFNKTLIQNSPFWAILKTRWFNPQILKID